LGLDLGKILKNCLITVKQYAGKGNPEGEWKSRKAISPNNCPKKYPFVLFLIAF
jgi:hypothetical protein